MNARAEQESPSAPLNPNHPYSMPTIRFLSKKDIEQTLDMKQAIRLMHEAFVLLSEKKVSVPIRTNIPLSEHNGRALFMPVYSAPHNKIALKAVSVHPNNDALDLPFIHALVLVSNATTGIPLAIMDGESITAIRTGAGSGLATDLLAHPDAHTIAIFGAGVQARTQLEAICAVRPIQKIYVFGRRPERAHAFAQNMSTQLQCDVQVTTQPNQLQQAHIIVTATTSLTPVFDHVNVKPGCHINGIGSYRPDMREIPSDTIREATIVVDHKPACLSEAGDILIPIEQGIISKDHIYAEIGEIANGEKPGRTAEDEITFFKSVGNAVQDLAVASYLAEIAQTEGLGIELSTT